MKNTKRFSLGLLSSLLLAVGLVRAADRLDPLTSDLKFNENSFVGSAAAASAVPSYQQEEIL